MNNTIPMTTPATREEVRKLIKREIDDGWPTTGSAAAALRILTALEQHGITLVPVEATEEMIFAARPAFAWVDNKPPIAQSYSAMIAASPYKKEPTL